MRSLLSTLSGCTHIGLLVLVFWVCSFGAFLRAMEQNQDLETWFRSEYPAKARKLREPLANIECKDRLLVRPFDISTPYQYETEHLMKDGKALAILRFEQDHKPDGAGVSKVRCRTAKYTFELDQQLFDGP